MSIDADEREIRSFNMRNRISLLIALLGIVCLSLIAAERISEADIGSIDWHTFQGC